MPTISLERAKAAKKRALQRFSKLPCVTGVGITRIHGEYGVKVNLSETDPGVSFPSDIDGVPVRVEVTGRIKAR